MRVLFWTESFWPYVSGAQAFAAELLPALASRGHAVTIVTAQDDGLAREDRWEGFPVHRFPFRAVLADGPPEQVVELRREIAALKRRVRPDLVHLNSIAPSVVFHLATSQASPARALVTLHSTLERRALAADTVGGRLLRTADRIGCCAQAVRAVLRRRLSEVVSRSSVIYCGVTRPALAPAPRPPRPHLLCLGRLVHLKGFDLALRALARLRESYPDAQLTIAGDGPERSRLEEQARALGLGDAVEFAGWVAPADVSALINRASVLLLPSRVEALPLVAAQAALLERPVVAADVGGIREVIVDGETGRLVPPEDPQALADAARALIGEPALADAMGRAGRRRASAQFSPERCASAYDRLYHRIVSKEIKHASTG